MTSPSSVKIAGIAAPIGIRAACSQARKRNDATDHQGYKRAETGEKISRPRRR